jgi:uncharacterized membrane protein YkvA (DUF1232 family)
VNSNDIRQIIAARLEEESRTHRVQQLLAQRVREDLRQEALDFIVAYVERTPALLDAAYQAVTAHGILAQFQRVFDTVFAYWSSEYDFIPDHLGLLGILDDAYLSTSLIQRVASKPAPISGSPLMTLDLSQDNATMRLLIGEPVASRLDDAVEQSFADSSFQDSLTRVFSALMAMQLGSLSVQPDSEIRAMRADIERSRTERSINEQMGAWGIV